MSHQVHIHSYGRNMRSTFTHLALIFSQHGEDKDAKLKQTFQKVSKAGLNFTKKFSPLLDGFALNPGQFFLVGGLEHEFYVFHIFGMIIPTD